MDIGIEVVSVEPAAEGVRPSTLDEIREQFLANHQTVEAAQQHHREQQAVTK